MTLPLPAYLDTILDSPRAAEFPPAVHAIARAGYRAGVADHPQPVPWESLDSLQRHRWLQAGDFLLTLSGTPSAAGIRAVYHAGYRQAQDPWELVPPTSRKRWQRVADAMTATKAEVIA
jgi:hypothetical protein